MICKSLLVTYFSKIGINNKGTMPPKTIPNAADLIVGSRRDVIRSSSIWAITAPTIQAMCPLDVLLRSRFILQPE